MAHVWSFTEDPWVLDLWRVQFGYRPYLHQELALLERVFPAGWRDGSFATTPFKHRLPYDLMTKGGWARLVELAAELLRGVDSGEISSELDVPMSGRLRAANLYSPTLCEIVVAPVLRAIGEVIWQPQERGAGADYRVNHASGTMIAEVKRLCTSERQERMSRDRETQFMANMTAGTVPSGQVVPVFTDAEELSHAREDGKRLYPHLRKAAKQIAISARLAVTSGPKADRARGPVHGVVILDVDGNRGLPVLRRRIEQWMGRPWAQSIDVVVFLDYESCGNAWSSVVEPAFARSQGALSVLATGLRRCEHGHLHVRR